MREFERMLLSLLIRLMVSSEFGLSFFKNRTEHLKGVLLKACIAVKDNRHAPSS